MSPSGFQHGLQQGLAQQQTLSPQMRQSLKFLQANTLELSQLLHQAAEMNPTLEIHEEHEELVNSAEPDAEHDLENLSEFDDTWREDQILLHGNRHSSGDDDEKREFLYNSIVSPLTLQQHLLDQLNRSGVNDEKHTAADYLIGCINNQGFLDEPLEKLVTLSPFPLKELRSAQALIQSFDPAGVGTENLQESLLLQLQIQEKGRSLESRIVNEFLNELARRKYRKISRELGVSEESIILAADNISKLNPDPGSAFDATSNPHVTADLELKKDNDGSFYAQLTNEHIPKLNISNHYKDLLAKLNADPKARKYLRDNIQEGRQIINAVTQRQETLLKIGSEIIKHQQDFLIHGKSKLRPMTMHKIAESIGVHAATISRAASGKYILTPHGLLELRSFFTSGYTTQAGKTISNTGVRDTLQQIISNENTAKPYSDTALEKLLEEKGITIARRTIAKYRDQLGILPSHLRKQHR